MTGILPIKKYGTHSALNMFEEYSMLDPGGLERYVGFTESEVKELCRTHAMNYEEMQRWYDGYSFDGQEHVYSPKSVVSAVLRRRYRGYWSRTETYEALRRYIVMNFDGLKDAVTHMLDGGRCRIKSERFTNDMTSF